jgi:hypothetical protein
VIGVGGYVPFLSPMCIYNMLHTVRTKQKEFQKFLETTDNIDKNQHEIADIKARELRNDRYFNSARTK